MSPFPIRFVNNGLLHGTFHWSQNNVNDIPNQSESSNNLFFQNNICALLFTQGVKKTEHIKLEKVSDEAVKKQRRERRQRNSKKFQMKNSKINVKQSCYKNVGAISKAQK